MRHRPPPLASQQIADILAERILAGRLAPGEWIRQDALAAELGISRSPIRDALRQLHARGLVSLQPHCGARVTTTTARDIEISYKMRERLEPLLLAESIPNLETRDIEAMREVLAALTGVDDVETFLPLDRRFHWLSYQGNRVPALAQIVERLWDTTQSYRRAYAKIALRNGGKVMRAEHEMLFSAIERREVETAQHMLLLHLSRTRIGLEHYGYLLDHGPVERTSAY